MFNNSRRILTILIFLWFIAIIFMYFHRESKSSDISHCEQLLDEIKILKAEILKGNNDLISVNSRSPESLNRESGSLALHLSHESVRRRMLLYTREIHFLTEEISKLHVDFQTSNHENLEKNLEKLNDVKSMIREITLNLEVSINVLGSINGQDVERIRKLDELSNMMNDILTRKQNPKNCSKAKFVVTYLDRPCAFGCNTHHLIHCFQMALATDRILLVKSAQLYGNWWLDNFMPLSDKCTIGDIKETFFYDVHDTSQAILCPYIVDVSSKYDWIPTAVPNVLIDSIKLVHSDPFIWYAGQLAKFLMRPKPHLKKRIDDVIRQLKTNSSAPLVGIHVRRTDKINTEASFHSLKEYMVQVDRYYDFHEAQCLLHYDQQERHTKSCSKWGLSSSINRRVYLATDEPSLFKEAEVNFVNYTFIGDVNRSLSASVEKRGQNGSIMDLVVDIFALAHSDYLVCTFSSQVCRLAFELMQTRHQDLGDASRLAYSLDDFYYFGGQQSFPQKVVIPDSPRNIKYGDQVNVHGNNKNGYSLVQPVNSKSKFLMPSFKIFPTIRVANMSNLVV